MPRVADAADRRTLARGAARISDTCTVSGGGPLGALASALGVCFSARMIERDEIPNARQITVTCGARLEAPSRGRRHGAGPGSTR